MKKGIGILIFVWACFLPILESNAQYTSRNAPIGGGGFVTGIVTHPTSGDRYCRTDVGGAYRWDAANNKWVQLLDWFDESESGFYGVEALALDPQDANNMYMLCGTSYIGGGRTAVLKSTDKGNTFTYTDVTSQFKAHGNGGGRGNGERLAVDPHNSNILFCGTRANGLWKSTNAGVTWNQVWTGVTTTTNENGICVVLFDPLSSVVNGATQTFYIGVSRTGGGTFYKTTNGGSSFTDISPTTTFMPHRAVLQGTTMYVTYADGAGPAVNGDGKLYKLNTSTGVWTNVTPGANTTPAQGADHSYGGVSIDPNNVNRVVVSTCGKYWNQSFGVGWGDFVFITTDGGSTWTLKNGTNATFNNNGIGWVSAGGINWMDCIEFDQSNTNIVRVIGGGGVFTCPDITATNPSWKYDVVGIEETAWLDGISIPGGSLITSFGDVAGFVHNPITSYPSAQLKPTDGNNQSIAYAGSNTSKVVRASNGGNVVYYSTNMGSSWTGCSSNMGANGKVAISADGGTILHCPGGSSTTYYTTNNGGSWTGCSGVSLSDAIPVGDLANANYFYIFNPTNGQMFVSSNKGVSFSVASTPGTSTLQHPWVSTIPRAVPGKAGHIWLPLGGNGLRYSTNYGATFTNVSNVSYCRAVGIGVASGSNYPTVFIWGTVSGVTALFMSTDQGVSWTRINDNAHQFGGASFLIGDMNVFGRVYMASNGGRGVVYWELSGSNIPPTVNLTAPANNDSFCEGTPIALTATATDSDGSITKVEFYDGTTLLGTATASPYTYSWTTTAAGTHTITAKVTDNAGASTTSSSASITAITSSMLTIIPDTICKTGIVTLEVTTLGGPFEWYDSQSGGTLLYTGSIYEPTISATTDFYVQDGSGVGTVIGPTTEDSGNGWYTNTFSSLENQYILTITQSITLESVYADVQSAGSTITINVMNGTTLVHTTDIAVTSAGFQELPLNFSLTPGTYTINAIGSTSSLFLQNAGGAYPIELTGYVSIENAQSWAGVYVGHFYNWKFKSGSSCVRTPVQALLDPLYPYCNMDETQNITLVSGWNLISINVHPNDSTVEALFNGLDVQSIKTMNSFWYKDQSPFLNTLQTITVGEGYLVYMNAAGTLSIEGVTLSHTLNVVQKNGWQLIGCPYQTPTSFSTDFNATNCSVIKNFDGFWEPNGTQNSIQNLEPGKGYLIK